MKSGARTRILTLRFLQKTFGSGPREFFVHFAFSAKCLFARGVRLDAAGEALRRAAKRERHQSLYNFGYGER